MFRILIVLATVLAMNGCAGITLVENKRQIVAGIYSVEPQINWNRLTEESIEIWTVDGPLLQSIRFFESVDDGESLFPNQDSKRKLPVFHDAMTATEIQELVIDTLAALGAVDIDADNLRPVKLGNLSGFRFELEYQTENGLEQDGLVAGATSNQKLYLILYTGDRSYYYSKYLQHVEAMIRSIQTTL